VGALIVGFVFWLSGALAEIPNKYAQRVIVDNLSARHDLDYKYLDEKKMNKDDYLREHTLLREEMKNGFSAISNNEKDMMKMLVSISSQQQIQYRKQDKRAKEIMDK